MAFSNSEHIQGQNVTRENRNHIIKRYQDIYSD